MKAAQIVKVKFEQRAAKDPQDRQVRQGRYPYRKPLAPQQESQQEYTYLIPEGGEVNVGDVLVVPVGPWGYGGVNGFTRRATVIEVSTLDYKYAIGKVKVELF